MIFRVPVPSQPHAEQTTVLSGVTYLLRFDYVQRMNRWRLGIYTSAGTPIVLGIGLVPGTDLLAPYRDDTRIPPGVLAVVAKADPGRDAWGRTADLIYVEPAEAEASTVSTASGFGGGGGGGEPIE